MRARPGAVPAPVPSSVFGEAVDLATGPGLRARVVGTPVDLPAQTTGVFTRGPAVVTGVVLYEGDEPADSLCTP